MLLLSDMYQFVQIVSLFRFETPYANANFRFIFFKSQAKTKTQLQHMRRRIYDVIFVAHRYKVIIIENVWEKKVYELHREIYNQCRWLKVKVPSYEFFQLKKKSRKNFSFCTNKVDIYVESEINYYTLSIIWHNT